MAYLGKGLLSYGDNGGEVSSVSFNMTALTAANFDAQNTKLDEFQAALEAVTLGLNVKKEIKNSDGTGEGTSTEFYASRELKWLVSYRDTTTNAKYTMELPCPVKSADTVLPGKEKLANLTHALWTTFKTKFEACILSKDGNATEFLTARIVGRNN